MAKFIKTLRITKQDGGHPPEKLQMSIENTKDGTTLYWVNSLEEWKNFESNSSNST